MKLLVTLGCQTPQKEKYDYCAAALIQIDWDKKEITRELGYVSPPETASYSGHMHFTFGQLLGRQLLAPTASELVFVDLCSWSIEKVISLPQFNDIHHATVLDGHIYVCNTGLQCALKLDQNGLLLDAYSAEATPTWQTYDRNRDYRQINTKPHSVHPNYVFQADGHVWATRFQQKDAIALDDPQQRLSIEVGNPHDGLPAGDLVYFTTTGGFVVGASLQSGRPELVVNLNDIDARHCQLGWCRGITLLDDGLALVAFTCFRPTKWRNMAHWVLQDGKAMLPSRIALYDLKKPRLLEEMNFSGKWEGAAIYSMIVLPA